MSAKGFELRLSELFEYQRVENEPGLARLIAETLERCPAQLDEDELGLVNAAGEAGDVRGLPYMPEVPHDD